MTEIGTSASYFYTSLINKCNAGKRCGGNPDERNIKSFEALWNRVESSRGVDITRESKKPQWSWSIRFNELSSDFAIDKEGGGLPGRRSRNELDLRIMMEEWRMKNTTWELR